jgi:DNA mismatch endonuclease (patch repair protein)
MSPSRAGEQQAPSFAGLRPSSEAASRAQRANRKKDTGHEVLLRKALWRLGLRYRKHLPGLPGNPDLVFGGARVVVFCDGDFWHGRDWDRLKGQLARRHNAEYWIAKIGRNMERDREQAALLEGQGWLVIRLWETDVKRDVSAAASQLTEIVRGRMLRPPADPPRTPASA